MTIVAVGSVKGAPGATTAALALAAAWPPSRPLVVAELDPDGGVLAARRELSLEPGLVSAAAALLRGEQELDAHLQELSNSVRVLVAPSGAEQIRASVTATEDRLWAALERSGDVVIDLGRVQATSPALSFGRRADVMLLIARTRLEDVALLRDRVEPLRRAGVEPTLALVADGPYRADEIAAAVGVPVAAELPLDRRSADELNGVLVGRHLARSRLLRSVRVLLRRLHIDDAVEDRTAAEAARTDSTEVKRAG